MKFIKKLFKWIGLSIGGILVLVVLAGFSYHLFGPGTQEPSGQLINSDGATYRVQIAGHNSKAPTLIIEAGSGLASDYYHWLSEGLKDSIRVFRYDRAGLGYSDACTTPRDPETIARELHGLLEAAGEEPPYVLAGHSIGGPYISVFREVYSEEVEALVFLDATHPQRVERMNLLSDTSMMLKTMVFTYHALGTMADMGILGLYTSWFGQILPTEGLPAEVVKRTADFYQDGRLGHAAAEELAWYHRTLRRADPASQFGDMPIRVFYGAKPMSEAAKEHYRKQGIDLEERHAASEAMNADFLARSTDSKAFSINGDHNSMYTLPENAEIICREILQLYRYMGYLSGAKRASE